MPKVSRAVTVKMIDIDWIMKDKMRFLGITQILDQSPNYSVYVSDFVVQLLNEFWKENFTKIRNTQLYPYVGCFLLQIFYMHYALRHDGVTLEDRKERLPVRIILALLALASLSKFFYSEVEQFMSSASLKDHFRSVWNMNDVLWLTLCPFIIVTSLPSEALISLPTLVILSAMATFSLLVKVMDWMRLFKSTSFYILLIKATLNDVDAFLVLLTMSLLMFGIPLTFLNMNRTDENAVIDSQFDFWLTNLFLNQY